MRACQPFSPWLGRCVTPPNTPVFLDSTSPGRVHEAVVVLLPSGARPGQAGLHVVEERGELPELLLLPLGEGVVVALGAFQLHAQEEARRRRRDVLDALGPHPLQNPALQRGRRVVAEVEPVIAVEAFEQERELAYRMKKFSSKKEEEVNDAKAARERFIKANLRLVVSVAKKAVTPKASCDKATRRTLSRKAW